MEARRSSLCGRITLTQLIISPMIDRCSTVLLKNSIYSRFTLQTLADKFILCLLEESFQIPLVQFAHRIGIDFGQLHEGFIVQCSQQLHQIGIRYKFVMNPLVSRQD